ncbi:peroxiredoxin-like family protein [Streptomyces sp. NPDC093970]|uniref:peroxiredoxin-like family protein n=1 Tax=Streptomyces sp. NPDC093970 TaxID=3155076 RepID=UPI003440654C
MRTSRNPMTPGSTVSGRGLAAVSGDLVPVPDPDHLVHLQFRRFAGCPVCNLHLRSVVRRHDEIVAAGVREVVVFHSPADELRPHAADLPFAVVADPDKRLYREFGVEQSPRALLTPRVWGPIVRAVVSGAWHVVRGRERLPANRPHGGRLGLPADFLVAPDGRVLAVKYGEHAYDQWAVDELLALAARQARTPSPGPRPGAERP